ncbi:daf-6 [Cordylochernes scorpioides]|uniref:Daf-6 n=1 Tax=Cordylochernes scorpioides TaxID=51811 RepID=A0ABY6JW54_9ARAC|nr:daf-6 [Cordylochernes scorpioides]
MYGVMDYMALWDVNLNPPSMVSLIISVGFSVDNAAHITYSFVCSKMKTGDEKNERYTLLCRNIDTRIVVVKWICDVSGIGLDDTFVLMAAWRRTDPSLPLEKRIEQTYNHAGVSITITSLTNMTSFLLGATSPFHATNILCLNAAVSVMLTYLYQLCFFGGCLVLFGQAEERNLHSITMRKTIPKSLARHHGKLYQMLCTGGRDSAHPNHPDDNQPHVAMVFFRDHLGGLLSHPVGKTFTLILFGLYLGGGCYGCTRIREGQNMDQIFGIGTYANQFALKDMEYFYDYLMRYQVIIDHPLNYADPSIQRDIAKSFDVLESLPFASNSTLNDSWLKQYLKFINSPSASYIRWNYNLTNEQDFIYCLRTFFFKHPLAKDYQSDVIFNKNFTKIIASRLFYQIQGITDVLDARDATMKLWEALDNIPIKMFLYHPYMMIIEIQIGMTAFTLKTIAITALIMMCITLLFIPNLACSIWVFFTIVSIEIGVMGYMALWDVNLNPPSMVALIISVGFSVDNAAHITYSFVCSKMKTGDEKMKDALFYVGMPISQACISTIIGVGVLPLTASYNFHVFFKTMTLLMTFAMAHSLALLPVLLSLSDSVMNHFKSSYKKEHIKDKVSVENSVAKPFLSTMI